ncbi:hypothetical protein PTH_1481 [Pelotomaculum thermopropionicum SI]|uniref:Copper amine oxidase-like N-terminal domain-containing protein n=1 Tax=Pelotomaculum thermopropionicum (strain DSM 13744 / JCM 10971 / SI) TaxID=370438 RepID=A5D261_PELTS|nr:hypothetical protein PTH_1481 [Pelotomaculum thermopropionicum SI]
MRIAEKVFVLFFMAMIVFLSSPVTVRALPAAGAGPAMERAAGYLLMQERTQGRPLTPWSYVALAGCGQDLTGTRVQESCRKQFAELQSSELNGYSLLVLTLLAAGQSPYDYQGQNLVERIRAAQLSDGKFADNVDGSGMGEKGGQVLVNAHIWAVLALYAAGAEIPDAQKARQWLIDQQHEDGSFNWILADQKPDVDSTGMALMALGALGEKNDSPVVQKAAAYLKRVQEEDGGFSSWGAPNPESCHMVISGLIAVGIDPAGADWTKPGGNPVTALQSYQLPDGSFEHIKGTGSNEMATEQALQALADVYYGKTVFERLREKNPAGSAATGKVQPQRAIRFKLGEKNYEVSIEGEKQVREADAAPFLENGRTFVPVRYLALALGVPESGIEWSPSTQTVTLANNGITVTLTVGGNILYVNGQPVTMDVTPLLLPPGRTYLPARYVAQAFGYAVSWDEKERTVIICK